MTARTSRPFALFNRVGHGWPDIYFSEQNNDAASLAQPPFNDAAVLNNGLVPKSVLSKFAHGSSGLCTIDGKVYCLRNDLAMNVLWYNPALMKQDGITLAPDDVAAVGGGRASSRPLTATSSAPRATRGMRTPTTGATSAR